MSSAYAATYNIVKDAYFEAVTPICLAINHIQNLLLDLAAHRIPRCPIVSRSTSFLVGKHILGIVDILVRARENAVYDTRFEIEKDCAGDVARVVGLVEENIFTVANLGREGFEVAVTVDAVFQTQLLPELRAD